jgi:preprotein translocase SecE subunit
MTFTFRGALLHSAGEGPWDRVKEVADMNQERFDRLIRDMRRVFGVFGVLCILLAIFSVFGYPTVVYEALTGALSENVAQVLVYLGYVGLILAPLAWVAFLEVRKRSLTGRIFGVASSAVLLLVALILLAMGIMTLSVKAVGADSSGGLSAGLMPGGILMLLAIVPAFFGIRFLSNLLNPETRPFFSSGGWLYDMVAELRRVVWPTPKETANLTWVVLVLSVALGLLMWVFDTLFAQLYRLVGG